MPQPALFNTRDQWHSAAIEWQETVEKGNRPQVTTQLILVEIANGLAGRKFRKQAVEIIRSLQGSPLVEVVSISPDLFSRSF